MPKKSSLLGSALLPTVSEPGTYEWCEEVVECMLAAWRSRESAEEAFLTVVRAANEHQIWEMLSPPPPAEPITSLDGLIRRTAEPGQAEAMQIAIRFSGVLETVPRQKAIEAAQAVPAAPQPGAPGQVSMPAPGLPARPDRPLTEDEEIALGNALLDQYESQLASLRLDPEAAGAAGDGPGVVTLPSVMPAEPAVRATARPSAAQRKRERLERTHPDLAEAVDAGEMTLKQALVEAGIEKEVRTIDKLQRLWQTASEEERERFRLWLAEQEQAARRREYEEEVYGDNG